MSMFANHILFIRSMLLGVGKFIFIFSMEFFKDRNTVKYSNIGKIIVLTNLVPLPNMNCR